MRPGATHSIRGGDMTTSRQRWTVLAVMALAAVVGTVTKAVAVPAPNDACASATVVTTIPYTDSVTTTATTTDAADPTPGCGGGSRGKSVWYRYTASTNSLLTADTNGSDYDTVLSVYTGSCGAFTPVPGGCDDDGGTIPASCVTFLAPAGTTY